MVKQAEEMVGRCETDGFQVKINVIQGAVSQFAFPSISMNDCNVISFILTLCQHKAIDQTSLLISCCIQDLEAQGFGGIFGVGKAAIRPPALVILSHFPPKVAHGTDYAPSRIVHVNTISIFFRFFLYFFHFLRTDEKSLVWVGKGIVYDTGGLSIKDKSGMPGMKRDMAGSAAMLAAFECAVRGKW
jgi:hypothetical protein